MLVQIAFFLCVILQFTTCEEIEDKCNFVDSRLQPNTFRQLSKMILPSMEGRTKGELGKIGVIGGSIEYTGAPYFSAISSLKVGSDLVYVITTESASSVIKGYSPDLIVYPFLSSKYSSKIRSLLPKMDVIVIGPGLGREDETLHLIYAIIEDCKNLAKPLVIDADGLYAVSKNSSILKKYPCPGVILTPNQREAKYLMDSVSNNNSSDWYSNWGECVSVLVKGEKDYFYSFNPIYSWVATGGGSKRRVGGQGDILSGALATFYHWALNASFCKNENHNQLAQSVATYAAAKFTRSCNYHAYLSNGRGTIASDMINNIHAAFESTFFWI